MYCPACRRDVEAVRDELALGEVRYTCANCPSSDPNREPTLLLSTWKCGPCGTERAPTMALNGAGQIVRQCPECQTVFGAALSKPLSDRDSSERVRATVSLGDGPAFMSHDGSTSSTSVVASNLRSTSRGAAAAPVPKYVDASPGVPPGATPIFPSAPSDVVAMLRARLAFLDAELAKARGMELEAKQLRKMIAVADKVAAQQAAQTNVAELLSGHPQSAYRGPN